ncbi:MAG: hypothetical protein Udaeo2_30440 [Candidatus Udaeobacter sp.]|nr:MAG: hypothetical protein Udaeo2_30440 [Candidatus Udaeobacter sp.]
MSCSHHGDRTVYPRRYASPRGLKAKLQILLGMTADVLPMMSKFKHEQVST